MIPNARARPTAKRNILPAVAALRILRAETVRIKTQRVLPQARIPLYRHPAQRQHGAGLNTETVNLDITSGHPRPRRRRRAQPQSLVKHLNRITKPPNIIRRQFAIPKPGHLRGHTLLQIGVPAQRPQCIRQRRRCRVLAGEQKDHHLIADLVVRQRLPSLWISSSDQRVHQRSVPARVGATRLQNFVGKFADRRRGRVRTTPRPSRNPPRYAQRAYRPPHRITHHHPQRLSDPISPLIEI